MEYPKIGWILCFVALSSFPMETPHPRQDANGYRYRDENTVQDKRKIAILSYGSLVKQNTNNQTGAKLEATAFAPTNIQLPVSIGRQSQGNRLTAVIDKNGDLKRVWAATSSFQFLPNARNNLAAREGSPYRGQNTGYDLANIFYMKKLLPDRMKDSNEELIPNTNRWVIRTEANERQRIPTTTAQALAQWADANGYGAITWASFPPNISSQQVAAAKLIENAELLHNTQDYVKNLPDGAQSAFEKAIITGPDALRAFTVTPASAAPTPQPRPLQRISQQAHRGILEELETEEFLAPAQQSLPHITPHAPPSLQEPSESRIEAILSGIKSKVPNFLKNVSKNVQLKIMEILNRNPNIMLHLSELTNYAHPESSLHNFVLEQLAKDANMKVRTGSSSYTFFEIPVHNLQETERRQLDDYAALNNLFESSKQRYEETKKEILQNPRQENLRQLLPLYQQNLEELVKDKSQLINMLVNNYKIHLMPTDNINLIEVALILLDAYKNDPTLKELIPVFKIANKPLTHSQGHVLPRVVLYVNSGKENAQKALNKIYEIFKKHPEIKGSGIRPRFNAKLNDLIWIAQGAGDHKSDALAKYYENNQRYYYRPDITGIIQNYHLVHPETGKELIE